MQLQEVGDKSNHIWHTQTPTPRLWHLSQKSNGSTKTCAQLSMNACQVFLVDRKRLVQQQLTKETHRRSTTVVTPKRTPVARKSKHRTLPGLADQSMQWAQRFNHSIIVLPHGNPYLSKSTSPHDRNPVIIKEHHSDDTIHLGQFIHPSTLFQTTNQWYIFPVCLKIYDYFGWDFMMISTGSAATVALRKCAFFAQGQ